MSNLVKEIAPGVVVVDHGVEAEAPRLPAGYEAIDTAEGIAVALKRDGLDGLRSLLDRRRGAFDRDPHLRLRQWIVAGHWFLDNCGQLLVVVAMTIRGRGDSRGSTGPEIDLRHVLGPIVEWPRLQALLPDVRSSLSFARALPKNDDTCAICGVGWTFDNAHDVEVAAVGDDGRPTRLEHRRCWVLRSHSQTQTHFKAVLDAAGFELYTMVPIENRYDKRASSPWFVVATPFGEITMGWRKRVISIEWPKTIEVDFEGLDKDTTHDRGMIHAWGYEMAEAHLRKIAPAMAAGFKP